MPKRPTVLAILVVDGVKYTQERLQREHDETPEKFTQRVATATKLLQYRHDP